MQPFYIASLLLLLSAGCSLSSCSTGGGGQRSSFRDSVWESTTKTETVSTSVEELG